MSISVKNVNILRAESEGASDGDPSKNYKIFFLNFAIETEMAKYRRRNQKIVHNSKNCLNIVAFKKLRLSANIFILNS